jgi:hypothetical protein
MSLEIASSLVGIAGGLKDLFSKRVPAGKEVYSRVQGSMRAAKDFGLHPLEVLGTAAVGATSQSPRLGTHTALVNGFDKLDDVLSGRQATRDKLLDAQADLTRIEADRLKAGTGSGQPPIGNGPKFDGTPENEITNLPPENSNPYVGKPVPPWRAGADPWSGHGGEVAEVVEGASNYLFITPIYQMSIPKIAAHQGVTPEELHARYAAMSRKEGRDAFWKDRYEMVKAEQAGLYNFDDLKTDIDKGFRWLEGLAPKQARPPRMGVPGWINTNEGNQYFRMEGN